MLELTTSKADLALAIDGEVVAVAADYSDANLSKAMRVISEVSEELQAINARAAEDGTETDADMADALAQVRRLPDLILGEKQTDMLVDRLGGAALSQLTKVIAYLAAECGKRLGAVREARVEYYLND